MGKNMVKEHTLGHGGSRYVGEWKDDEKTWSRDRIHWSSGIGSIER